MSDLYLELLTRIPVVAEQTKIGQQRLQDAQHRVGLSNEAIARQVPVSEKTWRRWKQAGSIPTASLPAVARALRLELVELAPTSAFTPGGRRDTPPDGQLAALLERVEETLDEVRDLRAIVEELRADPPAKRPASPRHR